MGDSNAHLAMNHDSWLAGFGSIDVQEFRTDKRLQSRLSGNVCNEGQWINNIPTTDGLVLTSKVLFFNNWAFKGLK